MTPEHSFVIPVYGDSPYLETCVQSLLAQTEAGAVLMAGRAPTEQTKKIAEQYRIPLLTNVECQAGIANDWNFALSVASTPWVTLAHQDDVYQADYRREILLAVQNRADALISFTSYTNLVGITERAKSTNGFVKQLLLSPFGCFKAIRSNFLKKLMLMPGCPICCPSVAFNKSLLGNFKFDDAYQCALDWEAWLRLADKEGSFVYVNKPLVKHRIHAQSETAVNIGNGTRKAEEKQLLEKLWGRWLARPIASLYVLGHCDNV